MGTSYASAQMKYDMRPLGLRTLITPLPCSNAYMFTPEGIQVTGFYTNIRHRLLARYSPPTSTRNSCTRTQPAADDQTVDCIIDYARARSAPEKLVKMSRRSISKEP